jgi:hypothetical protein
MATDLSVSVTDSFSWFKDERQSEIGDASGHVGLDQNVLALKVAVGDRRLHFLQSFLIKTFPVTLSVPRNPLKSPISTLTNLI